MKILSILITVLIIMSCTIFPKTYINFEEKVSNEIRENYSDIAVLFAHKVGCNCGCLG
jgi:hypothetical protein